MSAREQIMLFIEMVLTVALIAVLLFYFVLGDRIGAVARLLRESAPIFYVLGIMLLKERYNRIIYKSNMSTERARSGEYVIYLNFFHKYITDFVLFIMPIGILATALFFKADIQTDDIVQASLVFIIFYFWQRFIFKSSER
jgi:hypothetical protein